MNLEELNILFDFAVSRSIQTNREDLPPWAHRRAGIRAVVEALRDELSGNWIDCSHCGNNDRLFREILASDGVEAGTHGSPELDEDARKLEAMGQDAGPTVQDLFPEVFTPAAAPSVCEWTDLGPEWSSSCKVRFGAFASMKGRFFCPSCGKPIKFKDGSE
jgi:hypothetical protein